ncbi:hypothetical protein TPS_01126 [Trichinella pseudospiralis]
MNFESFPYHKDKQAEHPDDTVDNFSSGQVDVSQDRVDFGNEQSQPVDNDAYFIMNNSGSDLTRRRKQKRSCSEGEPCWHQLFDVSFIVLSSVGGVGISSGRRMDNGALLTNVRKALGFFCFFFFYQPQLSHAVGKWKARQFGAGRVCESVKATPSASSSECVAVEFGQVRPRAWADQLGAWFGYLFRTMTTDPNPLTRQGQRRLLGPFHKRCLIERDDYYVSVDTS